jgi:hypothetical protein
VSNWNDDDEETPLVKRLREEIKTRDTRLAELDGTLAEQKKELTSLRPQVRLTSVREVLSDLKVNPKVAKLIPSDVEVTKDAVSAWLDEYGDVLGIQKQEQTATTTETQVSGEGATAPLVTDETANQWERIQNQDSASGATTPDKETKDLAALTSAYNAARKEGGSDAFFAFLRGEQTP